MTPEFMGVPILGAWPTLARPPLADPNQLDYLVTFKHFCEHLRGAQSSQIFDDDELQKRYAIYKENFAARQLAAFFERHRKAEWFVEKYHPVKSVSRVEEARALRRRLYDKFVGELAQGKYDDADFDEPEQAALTRKEKKDGEEGEAEGEEQGGMDGTSDIKMMEDASEQQQQGESEQLSYKLIIKTVPPSISRKKIVAVCFLGIFFVYGKRVLWVPHIPIVAHCQPISPLCKDVPRRRRVRVFGTFGTESNQEVPSYRMDCVQGRDKYGRGVR